METSQKKESASNHYSWLLWWNNLIVIVVLKQPDLTPKKPFCPMQMKASKTFRNLLLVKIFVTNGYLDAQNKPPIDDLNASKKA